MPKESRKSVNKAKFRVNRGKYKNEPASTIALQVIGTGANGTPKSVCVTSDHRSYLFNCGEGLQRLSNEHKLKINKTENIFITHKHWDNLGGLAGLTLTFQDMGVVNYTLHGPPRIEDLFTNMHSFISVAHVKINKHQYFDPPFQDGVFKIESVPIFSSKHLDLELNNVVNDSPENSNDEQSNSSRSRGPLLGKLKKGEDVILDDGRLVKSSDVVSPTEPGLVFIIIECPTEDFLDSLLETETFKKHQTNESDSNNIADLIVHFTPNHVLNHPKYKIWISRFPHTTQHLLLNESCSGLANAAVYKLQHKLNIIHPEIFPLLKTNCELSRNTTEGPNFTLAEPLMQYLIKPKLGFDRSRIVHLEPNVYLDEIFSTANWDQKYEMFKTSLENFIDSGFKYPNVIFLGTGSCIPSKARNVTCILLKLTDEKWMILDCGEGSYGQILRFFGTIETESIMKNLVGVFISHLHADHHTGLIKILHERQKVSADGKLFLIAPYHIERWLTAYNKSFAPISDQFELVPNNDLIHGDRRVTGAKYNEIMQHLDMREITTVKVLHRGPTFGVVLTTTNGAKLVYSGDTMPCDNLVKTGQKCDLLIHEATMEDNLIDDAKNKTHSTTKQAIDVGARMKARFTMLTHFSQRYAKVPIFTDNFNTSVGVAFDNMMVSMNNVGLTALFRPILEVIFSDEIEEMRDKREIKQRHKIGDQEGQKMPKETAAQETARRKSSIIDKCNISLQVIGNGVDGTPKCLRLSAGDRCYLFNCGEGTQRLLCDHQYRISTIKRILITHKHWNNIGGLPGLTLTLQGAGVKKYTLFGPPRIENFVEGMKCYSQGLRLQLLMQISTINVNIFMRTCGILITKLKNGEDVTLENGKLVKSQDVFTPTTPPISFIIVDCPSVEFLDSLLESKQFEKHQIPVLIVHFTPIDVFNHANYKEWISRFSSSTQHLILNESCPGLTNSKPGRLQHKLNLIDPEIFPLLKTGLKQPEPNVETNITLAGSLLRYEIRPHTGFEGATNEPEPEVDLDVVNALTERQEKYERIKKSLKNSEISSVQYPQVIFLGTGSSISNSIRNVSCILLRLSEAKWMLMDCGEGSYGQIVKLFGLDETANILRNLVAIFISHLHADHHLGLLQLIIERKKILKSIKQPFYLIAPNHMEKWLEFCHQNFTSVFNEFIFTSNNNFKQRETPTENDVKMFKKLELKHLGTVKMIHTALTYGIVLTFPNGSKIVYSADTMPSDDLITEGKNCDLLIHEATLDDSLNEHARNTTHSTTSQAIDVGRRMAAKFVLLTHFSSRYNSIPVLPDNVDNVGIAFDNMIVSLTNIATVARSQGRRKWLHAMAALSGAYFLIKCKGALYPWDNLDENQFELNLSEMCCDVIVKDSGFTKQVLPLIPTQLYYLLMKRAVNQGYHCAICVLTSNWPFRTLSLKELWPSFTSLRNVYDNKQRDELMKSAATVTTVLINSFLGLVENGGVLKILDIRGFPTSNGDKIEIYILILFVNFFLIYVLVDRTLKNLAVAVQKFQTEEITNEEEIFHILLDSTIRDEDTCHELMSAISMRKNCKIALHISKIDVSCLGEALLTNLLHKLDPKELYGVSLQYNSLGNNGFRNLQPILAKLQSLTALDISCNSLQLPFQMTLFHQLQLIERLDLSNNRLSNSLSHILPAKMLRKLKYLKISASLLHQTDLIHLYTNLNGDSTIFELDLSENSILSRNDQILSNLLASVSDLHILEIEDCKFTGSNFPFLVKCLLKLKKLEFVNLARHGLSSNCLLECLPQLGALPYLKCVKISYSQDCYEFGQDEEIYEQRKKLLTQKLHDEINKWREIKVKIICTEFVNFM
uniref:Zinc phosphodiesterase ELAC protein 2 n=1 Tax=Strigamia maritima TaxID=126957 RepID=T1J1X8_STRMM